jgi:hypothetical protein
MGSFTNQPEFATRVESLTPSDTIDATTYLGGAALYVGTAGDVTVIVEGTSASVGSTLTSADAVTFKNVGNGCFLPVICAYVLATGTGATNILSIK